MKFSKKNMSQSKHSNLDTIKKKPKTKKLNIGELLATKPDNTYTDRSKNKNLKLLKVYGNYLIEYNNNTFFCNIKSSGDKPKIKLELEEEYKLIKKYNLSHLDFYEKIDNNKSNKAKSNDDQNFTIKLTLKSFDKSILNEYMDNSNKYIKLFNDTENNKELETIKTLVKKNPSLLTKCELIKHVNRTTECVTIDLDIKNNNFYKFYLGNLLHRYDTNTYCKKIPGSIWVYIIDYYINNYTNTIYKNKACTLYDAANKRTFEFCPGLNKLYTNDKIKQTEFINILLKTNAFNGVGYDLYNLSVRMIFETGIKFYEKYGYMTCDDYIDKDMFNYYNYYKCLSNFIDDITNRKIIMSTHLNKIISIINFLYKLKKLEQKTNKHAKNTINILDEQDKHNTKLSDNTNENKSADNIISKKDTFYNTLNDNEKIIFNLIDNKDKDIEFLKDIYDKYYKLNGYIEYFKLINSQFVDEFLKTNTLITIHDIYKFTLYLLDNLNKLFNNYKTITYNDYYKYANIIEDFTSATANSIYINSYYPKNQNVKYYNTCKYFINIGNNKYENFDKHVAMIHQKIKGVNADYIKPECFTTPPVNVIQAMIKKKEAVIFTPTEAYNKLLDLNNKLLDYYKLN